MSIGKRLGNASVGLVSLLGSGVVAYPAYETVKYVMQEEMPFEDMLVNGGFCLLFAGLAVGLGYTGLKYLYKSIKLK